MRIGHSLLALIVAFAGRAAIPQAPFPKPGQHVRAQ